jgi:hypothetical protein
MPLGHHDDDYHGVAHHHVGPPKKRPIVTHAVDNIEEVFPRLPPPPRSPDSLLDELYGGLGRGRHRRPVDHALASSSQEEEDSTVTTSTNEGQDEDDEITTVPGSSSSPPGVLFNTQEHTADRHRTQHDHQEFSPLTGPSPASQQEQPPQPDGHDQSHSPMIAVTRGRRIDTPLVARVSHGSSKEIPPTALLLPQQNVAEKQITQPNPSAFMQPSPPPHETSKQQSIREKRVAETEAPIPTAPIVVYDLSLDNDGESTAPQAEPAPVKVPPKKQRKIAGNPTKPTAPPETAPGIAPKQHPKKVETSEKGTAKKPKSAKSPAHATKKQPTKKEGAKQGNVEKRSQPLVDNTTNVMNSGTPGPDKAGMKHEKITEEAAKPTVLPAKVLDNKDNAPAVPKESRAAAPPAQPPARASPVNKKKKWTFQDKVLSHMILSAKPYTLKSLAESLDTTDTALNHLMLSLVDKGIVHKKEFATKKSKILFWVPDVNNSRKELQTILASEDDMFTVAKEAAALQQELVALINVLDMARHEPSNAELKQQLDQEEGALSALQQQLHDMKARIRQASSSGNVHAARDSCPIRMKQRINHMRDEWKNRKMKCTDFVDQLADAMEKKPKDVVQVLDIETDEACKVAMPPKYTIDK